MVSRSLGIEGLYEQLLKFVKAVCCALFFDKHDAIKPFLGKCMIGKKSFQATAHAIARWGIANPFGGDN